VPKPDSVVRRHIAQAEEIEQGLNSTQQTVSSLRKDVAEKPMAVAGLQRDVNLQSSAIERLEDRLEQNDHSNPTEVDSFDERDGMETPAKGCWYDGWRYKDDRSYSA